MLPVGPSSARRSIAECFPKGVVAVTEASGEPGTDSYRCAEIRVYPVAGYRGGVPVLGSWDPELCGQGAAIPPAGEAVVLGEVDMKTSRMVSENAFVHLTWSRHVCVRDAKNPDCARVADPCGCSMTVRLHETGSLGGDNYEYTGLFNRIGIEAPAVSDPAFAAWYLSSTNLDADCQHFDREPIRFESCAGCGLGSVDYPPIRP